MDEPQHQPSPTNPVDPGDLAASSDEAVVAVDAADLPASHERAPVDEPPVILPSAPVAPRPGPSIARATRSPRRRRGHRRAGCLVSLAVLAGLAVAGLASLPMIAASVARTVLPAFGITAGDLEVRISDGPLELLDLRADRVEVSLRDASSHGVTARRATAVVQDLDLSARTFGAVTADLADVTGAFAGHDVTFARAHIASTDGDHATVRLVLAADELVRRVDAALAVAGRPDVHGSLESDTLLLTARGTTRVGIEARDGTIHLVSDRFGDLPVVDVRGHGITVTAVTLGPDGLAIDASGSLRRLLAGG